MIIVHMLARFKSLLLSLITIFRRALCCFSRRRKPSFSDCEILTSINVVQNGNNSRHRNEDERDWNSWDDSPRTVSEHIEQYRQKLVKPNADEENHQSEPDFFQDMVPKVVKQKKMFIDTNKSTSENFSRLQATSAAIIPRLQTAELEDWSDEDNDETGWDEVSDEATKAMIREKRREARAQRHQRLQQQKLQQQQQQQQNQTKSGLHAHP